MSLPSRQTPIIGSIQRTLYPDQLQPDNLLALQRTVGNRAVQNLIASSRSTPSSPQPTMNNGGIVQRQPLSNIIQRDDLEDDEEDDEERSSEERYSRFKAARKAHHDDMKKKWPGYQPADNYKASPKDYRKEIGFVPYYLLKGIYRPVHALERAGQKLTGKRATPLSHMYSDWLGAPLKMARDNIRVKHEAMNMAPEVQEEYLDTYYHPFSGTKELVKGVGREAKSVAKHKSRRLWKGIKNRLVGKKAVDLGIEEYLNHVSGQKGNGSDLQSPPTEEELDLTEGTLDPEEEEGIEI